MKKAIVEDCAAIKSDYEPGKALFNVTHNPDLSPWAIQGQTIQKMCADSELHILLTFCDEVMRVAKEQHLCHEDAAGQILGRYHEILYDGKRIL